MTSFVVRQPNFNIMNIMIILKKKIFNIKSSFGENDTKNVYT